MKENKQYKELKVREGEYIPNVGIEYPEDPTVRMINPPKTHPFDIDEKYPYYDTSFWFRLNRFLAYLKCRTLVFMLQHLVWGYKCVGRENIKKNNALFKEHGCITTCNHAYRWDMVSVIQGTGHSFFIPMYGENMKTDDYWHMKYIGGVPIPTTMSAMKKYDEAMDKWHQKYWIHLFPEGIRWDFYKPLKPFHKGAFTMAYRWNCPILPCYITYRKRTGFYKLTGPADKPLITFNIGTPIMPDMTLPRKKAVEVLTQQVWDQMLQLGGIEHNPWPCFAE